MSPGEQDAIRTSIRSSLSESHQTVWSTTDKREGEAMSFVQIIELTSDSEAAYRNYRLVCGTEG